jgi:hypothetical protein
MFFNEYIEKYTKNKDQKIIQILQHSAKMLFRTFPEINGIIYRLGESDGVDVEGDFLSKIVIKSASQARNYLRQLLPVFEKEKKLLIIRNWTVGSYRCGDLMWNPRTYDRIFKYIKSKYFVISLKYGESDFFRHLGLSKLFFQSDHQKIIELQTRREYEGFGEFPSFVGFDYQNFYNELRDGKAQNLLGIYVWCQTGGWSAFRNFTFVKNTSFWNELNTHITVKIFKEKMKIKEALADFAPKLIKNKKKADNFYNFLQLSDQVIKQLLYDPVFAKQNLYFNRLRVPTILHVFWDNVSLTNPILIFYNLFVKDKSQSLAAGEKALTLLPEMQKIAQKLGLPYNYDFQYDSFELLYFCRRLIYLPDKGQTLATLKTKIFTYKKKYPLSYNFFLKIGKNQNAHILENILRITVRMKRNYRFLDYLLFNRFTARLYLILLKIMQRNMPQFIDHQAMPLSTIFKN